MHYQEQLKDPRWLEKSNEIKNLAGWKCSLCGSSTKRLETHHLQYVDGRLAWQYANELLVCLCSDCHKKQHTQRILGQPLNEEILNLFNHAKKWGFAPVINEYGYCIIPDTKKCTNCGVKFNYKDVLHLNYNYQNPKCPTCLYSSNQIIEEDFQKSRDYYYKIVSGLSGSQYFTYYKRNKLKLLSRSFEHEILSRGQINQFFYLFWIMMYSEKKFNPIFWPNSCYCLRCGRLRTIAEEKNGTCILCGSLRKMFMLDKFPKQHPCDLKANSKSEFATGINLTQFLIPRLLKGQLESLLGHRLRNIFLIYQEECKNYNIHKSTALFKEICFD